MLEEFSAELMHSKLWSQTNCLLIRGHGGRLNTVKYSGNSILFANINKENVY